MTEKEIFENILSEKKWYAGLRGKNGNFHTAQSANRIKDRYKRGVLNQSTINYIIGMHGWVKDIIWTHNGTKV